MSQGCRSISVSAYNRLYRNTMRTSYWKQTRGSRDRGFYLNYSEYQLFLYQTISEHREQGMTFDAIAEWLNKEGYLTVRGKKFRGTHVHSILNKRLAKEELLNREYPPVWSDFSMEVVDKTISMSDFGFEK